MGVVPSGLGRLGEALSVALSAYLTSPQDQLDLEKGKKIFFASVHQNTKKKKKKIEVF